MNKNRLVFSRTIHISLWLKLADHPLCLLNIYVLQKNLLWPICESFFTLTDYTYITCDTQD